MSSGHPRLALLRVFQRVKLPRRAWWRDLEKIQLESVVQRSFPYRRSFTGILAGRVGEQRSDGSQVSELEKLNRSVKVPSTLLVVSPALSLLGKSSAFRVGAPGSDWSNSGNDDFLDAGFVKTVASSSLILRGAVVARGLRCRPIRACRTAAARHATVKSGGVRNMRALWDLA